jgi:CheY-like chemotaxis protein
MRQQQVQQDKAPGTAVAPASGSRTVLVIDDDADARSLMRRFLAREGFDTLTTADGSEGLRLARQFKPSLIILDVLMPRMDGWAVLRELQSDPALAAIPVVMLSILDEQKRDSRSVPQTTSSNRSIALASSPFSSAIGGRLLAFVFSWSRTTLRRGASCVTFSARKDATLF